MEQRNRRILGGVILLALLAGGAAAGLSWRNAVREDGGYLADFSKLSLEGEAMYPALPEGAEFAEIGEEPVPLAGGPGTEGAGQAAAGQAAAGQAAGSQEPGADGAGDRTGEGAGNGTGGSGPEAPAAVPSGMTGYAREVFDLVNEERTKAGLPPFTQVDMLTEGAQIRAEELVKKFDHTRPDGRAYKTVLADAGISYRNCGENVAFGQRSPSEVVAAWMGSEGHRQNILRDYASMGVGYYESGGVRYWSQLFLK